MAKIIDTPDKTPRHYPWDQWLDGRTWQLTRGVDFACTCASLRTLAHRAAARRGGLLTTSIAGEDVTLRFEED